MSTFLDFDPETGIRHDFAYDEMTGLATIRTMQDVEPLLKYTREMAASGAKDKGIKGGWWMYAKIPAVVELEMRKKGIRLTDPDATKRIMQEINENYPHLKVTEKNDSGIAPKIYIP
jgi:hypothetical protein